MLKDTAGSIFKQAKELNLQTNSLQFKDRVGGANQNDFFRFGLKSRSSFNLDLTSLGGKADVALMSDRNGNGRVDRNEIINSTASKGSAARGNGSKLINRDSLEAGTYFIRVFPKKGSATQYSLTLSTTAIADNGLSGSASGSASNPSPANPVMPTLPQFVADVLRFTNDFRQQNNLKPLAYSDTLSAAALTQSQNMAVQDFFAHEAPDGSTPQIRGTAAGYRGGVGENIAAGYATPRAVVDAWINSPGHRANLLNPSYQDIGIGFYDYPNDTGKLNYTHYWTQDFGIPA